MMRTLFFLALLALAAIRPETGRAQQPSAPIAPVPAAAAPALSAAQAQQALDVLQDPQKRTQLITTLQAIAHAQPAATSAPAPGAAGPTNPAAAPPPAHAADEAAPKPPVTLKPHSLGAQLLVTASRWSATLGAEAAATLGTMNKLPELWRWITDLETDPEASASLLTAAGWVAGIVGVALLLELVASWILRRPRRALLSRLPGKDGNGARLLRLLPYALVRLLLDLVPVAVFAAAGNALVGAVAGAASRTGLVVIAVVNAYAACRAVMCVGRMLLSPDDSRLRLWRMSDAHAAFVLTWLRRLVVIAIFGDALVEVALLLGLDQSAHDGFDRLIALVLAVMLVVVVVRSRRPVGDYIRGDGAPSLWRGWLAEAWPYLAIIAIVSFWIGMATGTRGGLSGLYFPGVTLAAIIGARLLAIVVLGTLDRALRFDPEKHDKLPGLNRRMAQYRRPLEGVALAVITALCIIVILQLWGAPAFDWFIGGRIGGRLVSALLTIAVAVAVSVAIWEVTQAALERQLAPTETGAARSVRLLTLLPLLRAALLTTILTVVGLTALSEIGVNIAPLLAGAGIVGIAVGFGSQRLVQDVITGMFVLFENAIHIGDGVTVAGLSGTIEQLSVRTIRLRAGDGSVHIIPFSSVTTITNSNRGLGNAAVAVTVAYQEDTDRVVEAIREIVAGMREDADFGARIIGDFSLWGVDSVRPWGVTILGQVPCLDTGRWPVQREFNRRMKKRFDELGIVLGGSPQAAARS